MNNEIKEIIEAAADKYADEVCAVVEKTTFLTPAVKENYRTLLATAYFCGAAEMMEVLKEVAEEKENPIKTS